MARYRKINGQWYDTTPEETGNPYGTKAEFEAIKDTLPVGSAYDTTDEEEESLFTIKEYSITTSSNTYVTPFNAYANISLADDVALYGRIVSIIIIGSSSEASLATLYNNNDTLVNVFTQGARTIKFRALFAKLGITG